MDKKVLMTARDFVALNTFLLNDRGMIMYGAKHRTENIGKIDLNQFAVSIDTYVLLIGFEEDEDKLLGRPALDLNRNELVDFVSVRFGGEDSDAIGTTLYLADTSKTATLVDRGLTKILKRHAHKGVLSVEGRVDERHYWTDDALASGRIWHMWLRTGSMQYKNKLPGLRPKP